MISKLNQASDAGGHAGPATGKDSGPVGQKPPPDFIYVKFPGPLNRSTEYAGKLHERLTGEHLGAVSSYTVNQAPNEHDDIRIHVTNTKLIPTLELLRKELRRLKAPVGTQLLYVDNDNDLRDELRKEGWVLRLSST